MSRDRSVRNATPVVVARVLAVAALILCARAAWAHPAGISSVNRYLGVQLGTGRAVRLAYLLDFAELPAYAQIERLDANHDNAVTPEERDRFLDELLPPIAAQWTVRVDGRVVRPTIVARNLEAPPGQGGMSTLRITVELAVERAPDVNAASDVTIELRDTVFAERSGWREMGAGDSDTGTVVRSTVGRVNAPLAYGDATATAAPPRVNEATFVLRPRGGAGSSASPLVARGSPRAGASDGSRLAQLLRDGRGGTWFLFGVLALAFALGAGHALSPGHGKALVAAYLVGSRGTPRHAIALGSIVTLTHTSSVFVIGLLALSVERTVGSDRLLRWLEIGSGVLIVAIAAGQLPGRIRALRQRRDEGMRFVAVPRAAHANVRAHGGGTTHRHLHGGGYAHAHTHSHRHSHAHSRGHADAVDDVAHAQLHATELANAARWRDVVLLGVSGGLVPCPGALVVLLVAMALHRLALGLAMIVAFSLGLAVVLTAIGLVFVLARRWIDRAKLGGSLMRVLPVVSSACVLMLGVAICVVGWIRR